MGIQFYPKDDPTNDLYYRFIKYLVPGHKFDEKEKVVLSYFSNQPFEIEKALGYKRN